MEIIRESPTGGYCADWCNACNNAKIAHILQYFDDRRTYSSNSHGKFEGVQVEEMSWGDQKRRSKNVQQSYSNSIKDYIGTSDNPTTYAWETFRRLFAIQRFHMTRKTGLSDDQCQHLDDVDHRGEEAWKTDGCNNIGTPLHLK